MFRMERKSLKSLPILLLNQSKLAYTPGIYPAFLIILQNVLHTEANVALEHLR